MAETPCLGCSERDARIAELEVLVVELQRFQSETAYLRDQSKTERDLRPLTGESEAMKAEAEACLQTFLQIMSFSAAPLPRWEISMATATTTLPWERPKTKGTRAPSTCC